MKIPISWIREAAFCEQSLIFTKLSEFPKIVSEEMKVGSTLHEILELKQIKSAEINGTNLKLKYDIPGELSEENITTLKETFNKSEENKSPIIANEESTSILLSNTKEILLPDKDIISIEYKVECELLIGRIDELHINNIGIFVVDYKPLAKNGEPYNTDKKQTIAYCYTINKMFPENNKNIYAIIAEREQGNWVWKFRPSEFNFKKIEEFTYNLKELIAGLRKPKLPNNPNRCNGCRYFEICKLRFDFKNFLA